MITIENLSKSFGSQKVIDDINLTFKEGETTAVVGPSGVGKSVLLKLILGIFQPDHGKITIDNQVITDCKNEDELNVIRENMGVLFQSAALLDSLTIYENIGFPLQVKNRTEDLHNKIMEIAKELSLEDLLSKYPQEISLGVRKRAGMARALITKPRFFLFDEPNTGLDPLVGQEVYDLIQESKEKWSFTGIVISHEIPEVFQISDRVVMLYAGKVIADEKVKDFTSNTNPIVQQFIQGDINGQIKIH